MYCPSLVHKVLQRSCRIINDVHVARPRWTTVRFQLICCSTWIWEWNYSTHRWIHLNGHPETDEAVNALNSTGATVALTGRRCNSWTTATFLQPWHWIVHICMFNCKWSCSEHGFLQMSLLLCVFCVNREGRTSFFWKYLRLLCVCVWPYLCVCFPSSSRGRSSVWPAASQGFISAGVPHYW